MCLHGAADNLRVILDDRLSRPPCYVWFYGCRHIEEEKEERRRIVEEDRRKEEEKEERRRREDEERETRRQERELRKLELEADMLKQKGAIAAAKREHELELARLGQGRNVAEHPEVREDRAKAPKLPSFVDGKDDLDAYL